MQTLDYFVFSAYLVGIVVQGLSLRRTDRSGQEFFLAGRSMHWWPIGLSVMVTVFSAINYTAFPTEVFEHGLYVVIALPALVIVAFPISRVFIPFYHAMRLTSAYEYLEKRFDVRVRCMASGLFILWRIFWMATALYASGKILSALTGLDLWALILLAGIAAIAYTAIGGMRAVMWTDVSQFFVLILGIGAVLVVSAIRTPGGFLGILRLSAEGGLLKPVLPFDPAFFSLDPRIRITFWSGIVGGFTAFLARYGADQMVVQRYFTARSLHCAQRGFWLNVIAALVALCLLACLGLALYAHAATSGPPGTVPLSCPMKHFACLIQSLPYGVCGLVAAGLLAATMSSIDSGIHACSAAYVTDFHQRLFAKQHGSADRRQTSRADNSDSAAGQLNRLLTVGLGLVVVATALYVGRLGSLFAIANKIIHGIGSPLLALILMGMFSRRANSPGMLAGGIVGAIWSVSVSFGVRNLALHYYAVVNLVGTLVACYAFSRLAETRGVRNTSIQTSWLWKNRRIRALL